MHGIYKWASSPRRNLVPLGLNPCIGTELPVKGKRQPQGLRPAEWQALIKALDQINSDAADLAEFLVASGWRWSEATALDAFGVEDCGPPTAEAAGGLYVAMSQVARRQANGRVEIVQDAKSEAGLRRIMLDQAAADTVRERMKDLKPGGLIFTTSEGSMWNYAHFRNRFWVKAIDAANLQRRPTIHQLRHTAVGYLALSDAKLPEMPKRIGHESIKTTIDVYGSMIQDVNPAALEATAAIRGTRVRKVKEVEG